MSIKALWIVTKSEYDSLVSKSTCQVTYVVLMDTENIWTVVQICDRPIYAIFKI